VISKPNQPATFILSDGRTVSGKTLGIYETLDAGLMKITDPGEWPVAEQGESSGLEPGTWCVALGHPLGYQDGRPPVVRVGRILRADDDQLQSDCPLVAGDSGGPLFDLQGRVIGINSRIGGSTDMNYHVPVDIYRDTWKRLATGDYWEDDLPGKQCDGVKAALKEVTAEAARCVVRIECAGRDVALGTIVDPAGWILTKASELCGPAACRLADGRRFEANVVGIAEQFDLAMLKVDAEGLAAAPWSNGKEPSVGQWVAAPATDVGLPLGLGVVSVPRRPIPGARGVLGVGLARADGGARVAKVLPETPAEKAGLIENDVITHFDGQPVQDQESVIDALKNRSPGDLIRLTIRRGSDDLEVLATLGKLDNPATRKREMQNRSDIGISRRHDDFPVVLQHDMVLRPTDCGGPLVDLSGRVIGINVARGGRTETYSVPTDILLSLMEKLMSGNLERARPAWIARTESGQPPQTNLGARGDQDQKAREERADEDAPAEPESRLIPLDLTD
jgi:serine protease Do